MAYIMVVDDDREIADSTARVLKGEGHEVAVHLETESAFESMKKRKPDLLVLDVMFPENASGGFDFARKLSKEIKGLRILMLTAVNTHFRFDFSAKDIDPEWMPVTDFLEKPVEIETLKKTVARLLTVGPAGK